MNEKKLGITSAALKNIAIVTMFIDHIGACLIEKNSDWIGSAGVIVELLDLLLRAIGRTAFVLFAFQIGESVRHTGNKLKLVLRLLLFCYIAEIPFNLAVYNSFFCFEYQNVFFTLLFGAICVLAIESFGIKSYKTIIVLALSMVGAFALNTDYGMSGVLLVVLLYCFRNDYWKIITVVFPAFIMSMCGENIISCLLQTGDISVIANVGAWASGGIFEIYSLPAFILIKFYNGEKGKSLGKWFYYVFYPVHLLILFAARVLFF